MSDLLYLIRLRSARERVLIARIIERVVQIIGGVAAIEVGFAAWVVKVQRYFVAGAIGTSTHLCANGRGCRAVKDDFRNVGLAIDPGSKKSEGQRYGKEISHSDLG